MKVLLISKYPPLEGGVSSHNYWLARSLGERSVEVSVVTNALCSDEENRAEMDLSNIQTLENHQPKNVFFHSIEGRMPHHIPYSEAYLSRLVNLGLKVLGDRGADVIYTHYLEPYASAGFILKKITGLPLIVRHAGSDIWRLLQSEDLKYFLARVIQGADRLVFSSHLNHLTDLLGVKDSRIAHVTRSLDDRFFSPASDTMGDDENELEAPKDVPSILYLGKAGERKGLKETLAALSQIRKDFRFFLFTEGKLLSELRKISSSKSTLRNQVTFSRFVPPWRVPGILRSASMLIHLENRFPVPIHSSTVPYEAVLTQTPVMLSGEIFDKLKTSFPNTANDFKVVEDPRDVGVLTERFETMLDSPQDLKSRASRIREELLQKNNWTGYVDRILNIFESVS